MEQLVCQVRVIYAVVWAQETREEVGMYEVGDWMLVEGWGCGY